MTASTNGASVSQSEAAAVPHPRHLRWLYVLVAFLLAGMGGGAAQALYFAGDLGGLAAAETCMAEHGLTTRAFRGDASAAATRQAQLCMASLNLRQGLVMLAGAGLMPATAGTLMLLNGLLLRRRLRRGRSVRPSAEVRAATERFDGWCDTWRLTGRRRPELLLVPSGRFSGRAFTTGLPLARPTVVLPVGYAYAEPEQFDLAVLHELGHVRARDLLWASSVWWAGWLSVPALLVALTPMLRHREMTLHLFGPSLATAAVTALLVLVLRAALLRRRELMADRHAVAVLGDAAALHAALGCAPVRAGRLRGLVRRLFAAHPTREERGAAAGRVTDGEHAWDGGFAISAVTAVIAATAFQSANLVLADLIGPTAPALAAIPATLATALSGLILAAVLVPAWARRAGAARAAGTGPAWAGPVLGTALGTAVGNCVPVPGVAAGSHVPLDRHLPLTVTVLVVVVAALAALGIALAAGAARARRPRWRRPALAAAVLTTAVAITTTLCVTFMLLRMHAAGHDPGVDRLVLSGQGGGTSIWRWTAPVLLAGFVLAVVTGPAAAAGVALARWAVLGAGVFAGGTASVLFWRSRFRPGLSPGELTMLFQQQAWICALAGWAVAVAVLLLGRRGATGQRAAGAVPAALAAGLVAAALTGAVQFAVATPRYSRTLPVLVGDVRLPMWLLLVALLGTAPLLGLLYALAGRLPRPAGAPGRARPLPAALGTGLLAGALALLLAGGALTGVTVARHDHDRLSAAAAAVNRPQDEALPALPAAGPLDPGHTGDPGRRLDQATAATMLDGLAPLLPAGAAATESAAADASGIQPASCRELFAGNETARALRPRTAAVARHWTMPLAGVFGGGATVNVVLTSYDPPLPDLAQDRDEVARCPEYSLRSDYTDDGRIRMVLSAQPSPDLPYTSFRFLLHTSARWQSRPAYVDARTDQVLVGHNHLTVTVTYPWKGVPPPATVLEYLDQLVTAAVTDVIERLRR